MSTVTKEWLFFFLNIDMSIKRFNIFQVIVTIELCDWKNIDVDFKFCMKYTSTDSLSLRGVSLFSANINIREREYHENLNETQ